MKILQIIIMFLVISGYGLPYTGYPFFEESVSVKSSGIGNCYVGISDNPDAAILNPASLVFIKKPTITTSQTKLQTETQLYYLSYVQPVGHGVLGISWIQARLDDILETDEATNESEEVNILGTFGYYSNTYFISYGKKLEKDISLGITLKYLTSDLPDLESKGGSSYGYSTSIGLLYTPNDYLTFGMKIEDLFNYQIWSTHTIERSPIIIKTGASYLFSIFEYDIIVSQDISQTLKPNHPPEIAFGAEIQASNLAFRIGYNDDLTAGFGIKSGNIKINYAYNNKKILSKENGHKVSLTYKW